MSIHVTTLVFPVRNGEILLGMKKRGFGKGKWNGYGGKIDPGESLEDCARRETAEESGGIQIGRLRPLARLLFYFADELKVACQAYVTEEVEGEPVETDEMRPQWFAIDNIPYEQMWGGDPYWLPAVLTQEHAEPVPEIEVYFDGDKKYIGMGVADPDLVEKHLGALTMETI